MEDDPFPCGSDWKESVEFERERLVNLMPVEETGEVEKEDEER